MSRRRCEETTLVVLHVDRGIARHLEHAVQIWRRTLKEKLRAVEPPELAEIQEALRQASVNGREPARTSGAGLAGADHFDSDHERPYLTRRDAARIADVSLSTIDQWIRTGELASSKHGQTRRIKRADLEAFLNGDD